MELNRERLLKLADVIEEHEDHFHMNDVFSDMTPLLGWQKPGHLAHWATEVDLQSCGTTACIAGWAMYLWPAEIDPTNGEWTEAAREILGIDLDLADDLFFSFGLNAHEAAARLREIAAR